MFNLTERTDPERNLQTYSTKFLTLDTKSTVNIRKVRYIIIYLADKEVIQLYKKIGICTVRKMLITFTKYQ